LSDFRGALYRESPLFLFHPILTLPSVYAFWSPEGCYYRQKITNPTDILKAIFLLSVFPTIWGHCHEPPDGTGQDGTAICSQSGAAVFGQDGGPYRVRHFSLGQGVDGRRRWRIAGDGRGLRARVMSHDVKRIRLEVDDFGLASAGGPSVGTIVPYS